MVGPCQRISSNIPDPAMAAAETQLLQDVVQLGISDLGPKPIQSIPHHELTCPWTG